MLKRMQILIPEEIYESLRKQSFEKKQSMSQLIVEKLTGPFSKESQKSNPLPIAKPLERKRGEMKSEDYL